MEQFRKDRYERELMKKYAANVDRVNEKTLLLIKPDSLGDYILFRSFIQALHRSEKFKGWKITLLGNVWYKSIAEWLDSPFLHNCIWVDIHILRDPLQMEKTIDEIRSKGFELAFCPNYSPSEIDLKLLCFSGAKEKIAIDGDTLYYSATEQSRFQKLITKKIRIGERWDFELDRYRDIFFELLGKDPEVKSSDMNVQVQKKNIVVICAGANSPLRMWPAEHFAGLLKRINGLDPSVEFLILGTSAEHDLGEVIRSKVKEIRVINECGKWDAAGLCKRIAACKAMVANDSGPYHIAQALQIPVVCISNGNNYGRFTPYPSTYQKRSVTVVSDRLENTLKNEDAKRNFQSKVSTEPMSDIPVEKVFNAYQSIMRQ